MKFRKAYTVVPNTLIDDTTMHYTSKVVYMAMALSERKSGLIRLTVDELVEKAGVSQATALQALSELEAGGYIKRKRNWRFSIGLHRLVFASNTYTLSRDLSRGYTLIKNSLMDLDITSAVFCVLLFLYRCAGRSGRAFPSIRYIAGAWREKTGRGLDMAKSTVLRALKVLNKLQAIEKRNCDTGVGDKSCNSYFMTDMVLKFSNGGGSIFKEASLTKQDNEGVYYAGNIYGVGEFGELHNFRSVSLFAEAYYFDGVGVRITPAAFGLDDTPLLA